VKFTETRIGGAFVIELERHEDERGYFARTFCRREFAERGLEGEVEQTSVSYNRVRHTLRGLHYQAAPHQEAKVVRCVAGAIYDVIVDLRPASPTFRQWVGAMLSAEDGNALYIPRDVAHGFLTLAPGATVLYQMSTAHHADAARGLRWNDPALAITWPAVPELISQRDASYPLLEERHG
jgi:dTDP-4-dehydrorhamnose 3,5-epimerase